MSFIQCRGRHSDLAAFSRRTELKLSGIKWVFIDIGSTLVDEDDAIEYRLIRLQEACNESGISVSLEEIKRLIHETVMEQKRSATSRTVAKLTDSEELRARLRNVLTWRKDLEKPYPEARQVLDALSKRYPVGIIANQTPGTEARLKKWGLLEFVSLCLPSAEIGLSKPDPAFFELAIEKSGCKPEHTVMIGDRIDNDVTPAKSLGWKTIRVKQGLFQYQVPMSPENTPDFEVQRLRDVLDILL